MSFLSLAACTLAIQSGLATNSTEIQNSSSVLVPVSNSRLIPNWAQAQLVLDGCLRIFGTAEGAKNDYCKLELFTTNGILLLNHNVYNEADGAFFCDTTTVQNAGDYKLYLKPVGALRKKTELYFNGSSPLAPSVSFIWGDIDGNNTINQIDVDIISHFVGYDLQGSSWPDIDDDYFSNFSVPDCDLNHDGSITSTDVGIAFANIGLNGDL